MEHTEYVDLGRFETYIHYHFKDKHLLLEALSHSSYANEKHKTRNSNERLEFLGDSVLSIVVSEFLFHKYPDLPEGELTKLRASMGKGTACVRQRDSSGRIPPAGQG